MKSNRLMDWENMLSIVLIAIYLQAGGIKLMDIAKFELEMRQSPILPLNLIPFLGIFIPVTEIAIAVLLFFDRSKIVGYYLSALTMLLFTSYLLTLIIFYDTSQIPCACGGIFGDVSYGTHIFLNAVFFTLSASALHYVTKNTHYYLSKQKSGEV